MKVRWASILQKRVYVDQAPLPFPVLASHSAYDLERIEVLKGPQGTLFRQNSTGGAINYIAAKPTKEFAAGGDISYGRFNQIEGNAYISGPISETFGARVAVTGLKTRTVGRISQTRPFDRNGKQSYLAGRFLVDGKIGSSVHVALNVNGWRDTSQPQALAVRVAAAADPCNNAPRDTVGTIHVGESARCRLADRDQHAAQQPQLLSGCIRADVDVTSDIQLTSLVSYSKFNQEQTSDNEGTALLISDLQENNGKISSFNQEVRLANTSSSNFRWALGANYEKSNTSEFNGSHSSMLPRTARR